VGEWWQAFLSEPPLNLPEATLIPEARLEVEIGGQRFVAVFDLVAVEPGRRFVIVDWKTGRRRQEREEVAHRLQTMVYLAMAVRGGERYFGESVDPARVTMVYWFANFPREPHVFHYSRVQYDADLAYLESLIAEIAVASTGEAWLLTEDVEMCRYCVFRSLCGRGIAAGVGDDSGVEFEWFGLDDVDDVVY
jgi:RecB family exonuclease